MTGFPQLRVLSSLPDGFLQCGTRDLHALLQAPTLIHLPGDRPGPPLFVSTLLHGNETTGFCALQQVLHRFDGRPPRPLSIFIGNVEAARHDQRFLPGQPDYNRIWKAGTGPEGGVARSVVAAMRELGVRACIDIHNNTGRNPHYAIVNSRDEKHLALARRFSECVVYATYPDTSCSVAFAPICPSVTIEAGIVGDASGLDHVAGYLAQCIDGDVWLEGRSSDLRLYHTVAVVRVNDSCSVGMLGAGTDVELPSDVDELNFTLLRPGTRLGTVRDGCADCISVRAEDPGLGRNDYLAIEGGEITTSRVIMPAMLTTDCDIVKMDCLCYLMERLE